MGNLLRQITADEAEQLARVYDGRLTIGTDEEHAGWWIVVTGTGSGLVVIGRQVAS